MDVDATHRAVVQRAYQSILARISFLTRKFDDGIVVVEVRERRRIVLGMTALEWKQDVVNAVNDKFERRLSEEMAAVRLEIAKSHISALRWQFAQWLTLMMTIVATRFWR